MHCKVALSGVAVAPSGVRAEAQPATRNFPWLSFGVRVRVCVPYIYKLKIKKIIYPIGLRFAGPTGWGRIAWKNGNATGLRVAFLGVQLAMEIGFVTGGKSAKKIRELDNSLPL